MVPRLHVHRVKSDQGLSVSDRAPERAWLVSEVAGCDGSGSANVVWPPSVAWPGHCNLTTWPPLDPQNLGTYFIPRILAVLLWMTSDVLVLCQLELVPGWSKSLHKSKHYVWKFQTFLSKSQGRKLIDGRFVHVRQEGIQEELLECNHSKLENWREASRQTTTPHNWQK